ncbi:MAG: SDR family NAD(P)-dependent oxidoreductase [Alphaproteobacteria bacterium]|nr:SDR family NAD(P)-dependent oxidoreductase [Alphaproteobacteria bacterium]
MTNLSAANKLRYDLSGKAAIVTGGASGIGLATATMLARNGCMVAINFLEGDARGPEAVAKLCQEGLSVIEAPGSVGDPKGGPEMIAAAISRLGRLDLLVNNAGTPGVTEVVPPGRIDLVTDELWETILQTNLVGLFRLSKAAAPALKACHGAIVSVASIAGINRAGSSLPYGASKAAVINVTQNLARGLGPEIRVNAVAPGAVDSSWQIRWTNEMVQSSVEAAALKRRCTPEDLAEVIVFLGFGASMVTGQTLIVDGGLTL